MTDNASSPPDSNPDDPARRRFLGAGIGILGASAAGVVLVPAIPYVGHPLQNDVIQGGNDFVPVGKLKRFGKEPVKVELFADKVDAWNRQENVKIGSAWVVQLGEELVAFSTVCPHLGCAVDYVPEVGKFKCPCHRSAFSKAGEVEAGPSPRSLDRLEVTTREGRVAVQYARFKQGIEDKEPV